MTSIIGKTLHYLALAKAREQSVKIKTDLFVKCEKEHRELSQKINNAKKVGDYDKIATLVDERYKKIEKCQSDFFIISSTYFKDLKKEWEKC